MNTPAENKSASTVRYERYRSVVERVVQHDVFEMSEVHSDCSPEEPVFVTRVINDLEQDGWIVSGPSGAGDSYRWNPG